MPEPITVTILTGAALLTAIAAVAIQLSDAEDALKKKRHWMQCSLRNETQFDIIFKDDYFNSGMYYEAPPVKIDKYTTGNFSACNKSGVAGMSGGNAWEVILDEKNSFPFAIGFTDPDFGERKSSVAEYLGAEGAYDAATEKGTSGTSDPINGKDKDGNDIYFLFKLSSVTGHHSMFAIRQVQIDKYWDKD